MKFIKMHGCGNDFILINGWQESVPDKNTLARQLCSRHTGIGADGLIVVSPSRFADAKMRIFNPGGDEAEMCGNGIRCVARFLMTDLDAGPDRYQIETAAGIREVVREVRSGFGESYEVEMGNPLFLTSNATGMVEARSGPEELDVEVQGRKISGTPLSMGNPHFVVFVSDLVRCPVETWGPAIETAPVFPAGTNVEFVEVVDEQNLAQRTWERGAGATQACGSGASASAAVAIASGRVKSQVKVKLPGGTLEVRWDKSGSVYLSGDAVEVFRGNLTAPG